MATGYRVLQAHDGAHALRVAKSHSQPIQLLLTDMVMPRMNGAESARQIRRLHPETKVLFVSGYPAKARAEGLWPPPGGAGTLITQATKICMPSAFSPLQ